MLKRNTGTGTDTGTGKAEVMKKNNYEERKNRTTTKREVA